MKTSRTKVQVTKELLAEEKNKQTTLLTDDLTAPRFKLLDAFCQRKQIGEKVTHAVCLIRDNGGPIWMSLPSAENILNKKMQFPVGSMLTITDGQIAVEA